MKEDSVQDYQRYTAYIDDLNRDLDKEVRDEVRKLTCDEFRRMWNAPGGADRRQRWLRRFELGVEGEREAIRQQLIESARARKQTQSRSAQIHADDKAA